MLLGHMDAELTVRLTKADVLRAGVITVYILPVFWIIRGCLFAAILIGELGHPERGPLLAIVLATIATLLFELIMLAIGTILGLSRLRGGSGNGILGDHKYIVTEEGLVEETLANRSLHRWPVVGRPKRRGAFVMIPVRGVGYHLLPTRYDGPPFAHLMSEIEAHIARRSLTTQE